MSQVPDEPPPPYPGLGPEPPKQQAYAPNYAPPPQQQYVMAPPQGSVPLTSTVIVTTTGNCPHCHAANLITETDACAMVCVVILAICFFPIGLLYLLCIPCLNERRCPACGYRSSA